MKMFRIRAVLVLMALPTLLMLVAEGLFQPKQPASVWIARQFLDWKNFYSHNWKRETHE